MKKFCAALSVMLFVVNGLFADVPNLDSLRMEYRNGQAYIIHEVEDGETLYSISKRYGSSMNAIAQATSEVKKGLYNGMLLTIPYNPNTKPLVTSQTEHVVKQGETLYSISQIYKISVIEIMEWNDLLSSTLAVGQVLKIKGDAAKPPPDYVLDGLRIHVVQPGEGLYAVARLYEISVDDLVAWNDLTSTSLDVGQELVVGKEKQATSTAAVSAAVAEPVEENTSVGQTEKVVAATAAPATATVARNTTELPARRPQLRRTENGLATKIDGDSDQTSYLALHRNIPAGSLVAVRNEMNNQVVFVRIVGKLPDTGVNEKVIIRLSAAAVAQLKAVDPKFRVEINYLIDK